MTKEIIICDDCQKNTEQKLLKEIFKLLKQKNISYEIAIDTIGDMLIHLYNVNDEKVLRDYAKQTIKCVVKNTIKKGRGHTK